MTDNQIDKLVYELCRLTEEEIKIVEREIMLFDTDPNVNRWLSELPESSRKKIIDHNKNDKNNFDSVYNELAVGHLIATCGFNFEYEKELRSNSSKYTPDWYVYDHLVPF